MRQSDSAAEAPVSGRDETYERCRRVDRAAGPLEPVEGWSLSLRAMATGLLHSRKPMLHFSGPELIPIYGIGTTFTLTLPRAH